MASSFDRAVPVILAGIAAMGIIIILVSVINRLRLALALVDHMLDFASLAGVSSSNQRGVVWRELHVLRVGERLVHESDGVDSRCQERAELLITKDAVHCEQRPT